jgi:uncharacterized protein YecE (DUF72 family)
MVTPASLRPVHVGCSGWNYRSWRERFYPPRTPATRWLEHYATHFDTVEVNSTFYRLASRDAVARWVTQTPEHFIFTLKASRYLTHFKRLTDLDQGIARYYERIEPLVGTPKLGPIVWQLPERFQRDDERLAQALDALPPGRHCFEFRHASWFTAEVYDLLRWHGAALVIGDMPTRPFQTYELTTDWTLIRLHYGRRGRRGNYSAAEIDEWARRITAWRSDVEVFAYFNNDWEAFAPRNAAALRRALSRLEPAPTARLCAGTSGPPSAHPRRSAQAGTRGRPRRPTANPAHPPGR